MNRRMRRKAAALARARRRAQKQREFEGIKALAEGGYMVIHPSRVREWQIEQRGEVEAVGGAETMSPGTMNPKRACETSSPKERDTAVHGGNSQAVEGRSAPGGTISEQEGEGDGENSNVDG